MLFAGCVTKNSPQLPDTKFDEDKRDWAEVYRHEIKVAVENEDIDAYNFFFQEYMRERVRQLRKKQKKP
jgi:hypothetical protein